jgi:hypothetical protein
VPQPERIQQGRRLRVIVIVGHGPSILTGRGSVIDAHTVVRLKNGLNVKPKALPEHWGTRTDFLCARSLVYRDEKSKVPFWHFADDPEWLEYYSKFNPRHDKPSTGLCAVFCAIERGYDDIALIGFDRLLNPDDTTSRRWNEDRMYSMYGHDQRAEHACLMSLPARIRPLG